MRALIRIDADLARMPGGPRAAHWAMNELLNDIDALVRKRWADYEAGTLVIVGSEDSDEDAKWLLDVYGERAYHDYD